MFAWAGRLRVRHHLIIVCTILALPGLLLSMLWSRDMISKLDYTKDELLGLEYATTATDLMAPIARHRGLMASVIMNDADAAATDSKLRALEADANRLAQSLQTLSAQDDPLRIKADATALIDHWRELQASARNMSVADSFAAHTRLLNEIIKFANLAADRSGLVLDPESLTYSLMDAALLKLPPALLAVGNVRGMANTLGRLPSRSLDDQIRIARELATLDYKLDQLEASTQGLISAGGASFRSLTSLITDSRRNIKALNDAVNSQLIKQTQAPQPGAMFALGDEAYGNLAQLQGAMATSLQTALHQRSKNLHVHISIVASIMVLLTLLALSMVLKVCTSITLGVRRLSKGIDALSQGELGTIQQLDGHSEFSHLMNKLHSLDQRLRQVISQVQHSALQVRQTAHEIAQSNDNLSERTQQQATAIETTASSVEQITQTVKQNTAHAQQASQLANEACQRADQGGELISRTVTSVTDISHASSRIADIISVIDEIAFQTNLLALNAAVEAARAGDHGRGFAVVAGEVRTLAQRSATAASEIKTIITDSANKVDAGVALVKTSGKTLNDIMDGVREVTNLVSGIARASKEQTADIEAINLTVSNMGSDTQQNAALVEQSSAASRSMAQEAEQLENTIRFFTLTMQTATPSAPWLPTQGSHADMQQIAA